jgi:NAD(P)-dependent dehydrogenase (short-subunit alcohol dehydrogenase family)
VAIVTGSSRGIGQSIAENLAEAGARVVVSSRKAASCEPVAEGIRKKGGEAIVIPASISDKAQLENLVAETRKQLGPIDILVCNAASNPYFGPNANLPDEMFRKISDNNILSNIWLANMVRPDMAANKGGAIIIISSIGGMKGSTEIGAYCISKAADMQLARNLAVEWGPDNIRVNCIAPGLIMTYFAKALYEGDRKQKRESETPLRRLGEPDDIGGIAVMLASKAGSFITGQTIVADGGVTVR